MSLRGAVHQTDAVGRLAACGHAHHSGVSRRGLFKLGGAAAVGTATVGLWSNPADARPKKSTSGIPKPAAGYSPVLAGAGLGQIPFFLPIEIDPFTGLPAGGPFAPCTIDDFNGIVGVVEIDGVTTENSDEVPRRWAADIRYIDGVFRDRDGRVKRDAFTFL
jgi:hypothetical protein